MDRGRDIEREGRESERERARERERRERRGETSERDKVVRQTVLVHGYVGSRGSAEGLESMGSNQIISRRKTPTGGFTQKLQETVSDTLVFFPSHSVAVGLAQPHQSAGCLSRPTLPSRVLFAFSGRYGGERGHRLRDLFR